MLRLSLVVFIYIPLAGGKPCRLSIKGNQPALHQKKRDGRAIGQKYLCRIVNFYRWEWLWYPVLVRIVFNGTACRGEDSVANEEISQKHGASVSNLWGSGCPEYCAEIYSETAPIPWAKRCTWNFQPIDKQAIVFAARDN